MVQIKDPPCLVGKKKHLTIGPKEQPFITKDTSALLTSEHTEREGDFNLDSFLGFVPFTALAPLGLPKEVKR